MTERLQEAPRNRAALEDFENNDRRPPFMLTMTEIKLLGIAGVGFFLDAYDLFIINVPVATMLQFRLYGGHSLPNNLQGFLKAGTNIGSVIGQFGFGYAADAYGRKAVYGKELMLIMLGTILTITTPTGTLSPDACLIYLGCFRILLGIGTMLAYIFSNQGWGNFVGSLATIIVLECYKHVMDVEGKTSKVDGVWRIVIGISLIPAAATLYQRLTLPESTRYKASQKQEQSEDGNELDDISKLKMEQRAQEERQQIQDQKSGTGTPASDASKEPSLVNEKQSVQVRGDELTAEGPSPAYFQEFFQYFSEWEHFKILFATCACWFLLDIAFYGINLNQNIVLQEIGFAGKSGTPWYKLYKISVGGMIITALGFVPGYYATVLTIEYLGRKWIQIQGFLIAALFLGVLAGKFDSLSHVGFIACFASHYFISCYPAEVFPTKFKAAAHGLSAACGKAGAIISALVFNTLTSRIGTANVLWIISLLLPEVKGRDPDQVLAEEIRVKKAKAAAAAHLS
ncbi:phosphate transporter [Gymnopilus junonius]|uniref:Phosphate transporter n=1 Tax=Gymnopilus junonius TaxID=109634 RepID=A0A9P5NKH9_GYMJU|nr:phosphate transporter [Gymnopilus junonius]